MSKESVSQLGAEPAGDTEQQVGNTDILDILYNRLDIASFHSFFFFIVKESLRGSD